MSGLTKLLAEIQKKMLKLMAPMTKKSPDYQALENSDSESENISVARASTPVKPEATTSKTTPVNGRNNDFCELICENSFFDQNLSRKFGPAIRYQNSISGQDVSSIVKSCRSENIPIV